ncbi:hypothetical protein BELL_0788g00040 [Botrytis elliptica]|uniref:Uncharacterized protein n=1 Tax=Botrytis elliptica TaxID=278938 RepID=A0A4Z1JIR3_9HELO|nr:hypothetical protein BELL_0788g00040 [Botrytis elliptica]
MNALLIKNSITTGLLEKGLIAIKILQKPIENSEPIVWIFKHHEDVYPPLSSPGQPASWCLPDYAVLEKISMFALLFKENIAKRRHENRTPDPLLERDDSTIYDPALANVKKHFIRARAVYIEEILGSSEAKKQDEYEEVRSMVSERVFDALYYWIVFAVDGELACQFWKKPETIGS